MTKFKEVLEKAESFQKLAENPKREFLRRLAQQTGEELSPYTVSYKGLDALIKEIESSASTVYTLITKLNSAVQVDSYLQSAAAVSDFKAGSLFTIFNKYILPAQTKPSGLLAAKALQGVNLIKSEVAKLNSPENKVISSLNSALGSLSPLLNRVHKYEAKRSEWNSTDRSDAEESMTGTVGLADSAREFRYMLRQLHLDPNYNTPDSLNQKLNKAGELKQKLDSQKSTLSPSVYNDYVRQLNMLEQQIKREISKLKTFQPNS